MSETQLHWKINSVNGQDAAKTHQSEQSITLCLAVFLLGYNTM
jgi:hypothetical protein